MDLIVKTIIIGIFATIVIDLWATFSNKVLNFPRTNWAMVGRWLGHIANGKFTHQSIANAIVIKHENMLGWLFHYFIGVLYACFYVAMVLSGVESASSLLAAWFFGLITILSPWLIMQPALGVGICAIKAPKPNRVRLQNFAIHSIFGCALFYGWLAVNMEY